MIDPIYEKALAIKNELIRRQDAEVKVLREGLCEICRVALENKDPTFGDMAAYTLLDANDATAHEH